MGNRKYKVEMEISISQEMIDELYNRMFFTSKNPTTEEIQHEISDTITRCRVFDVDNISVTNKN